MKLLLTLAVGLVLLSAPTHALTLSCDVKSRGDQGNFTGGYMQQSTIDDFSPEKQVHVLNFKEQTATYKGPDFKAKLEVVNDKRVVWRYVETFENKEKTNKHTIAFKYIYLRKNHKLVAEVDFGPAYLKIVSVRARCKEYK